MLPSTIWYTIEARLLAAVKSYLDKADSFHCNVHIHRNINEITTLKGFESAFFYDMTKAATEKQCLEFRNKLIESLKTSDAKLSDQENQKRIRAAEYVERLPLETTCAAFFRKKTNKAVMFYNNNPAELENWVQMPARKCTHMLSSLSQLLETWGGALELLRKQASEL